MKIKLESLLKDCDIEFKETSKHFVLKTCPNCGATDKLNIDKKSYLWQCWKCKGIGQEDTSSGNIFTLLKKVLYLDNIQIKSILEKNEIVSYTQDKIDYKELTFSPITTEEKKIVPAIELPSNFFPLDCSLDSVKKFPEAYQYLINRFVSSKEIIKSFRLRYDPARKRIVFPAFTEIGKCVGFQARDITDRWKNNYPKCQNYKCNLYKHYYINTESVPINCPVCHTKIELSFYPKSINSLNFPKTEFFFNQQNIDWNKPVTLVEGPFDCINTPNAIGLLGRYLSDTQFFYLLDKKPDLILFLDGDQAGTLMNKEIYYKLRIFLHNIKIVYLEDGADPGSHSIDINKKMIETALNPFDWFIKKQLMFM